MSRAATARGDDLHVGCAAAEVRGGRRGRDRVRPVRLRRPAGAGRHRPRGERPRGAVADRGCAASRYDIEAEVFDGVHVEPTDDSMNKAVEYARAQGDWDGFVAVGGGSAIDTAKAINLLTTHPGELMDYINKPIGNAQTPPGQLKPLVAVPTTAGYRLRVHRDVRARHPVDEGQDRASATGGCARRLAVVDPLLTLTLPPEVTASAGMDIVCHAVESYTARWYADLRPQDARGARHLLRLEPGVGPLVREGDGAASRSRSATPCTAARTTSRPASDMMMAATFAGMGFGNSGVHIPHANAYPIAGMVRGLPAGGLPAGRADGAARPVGVADGARGLPVLLRRARRSGTCGRRRCWTRGRTGRTTSASSCRPCWSR